MKWCTVATTKELIKEVNKEVDVFSVKFGADSTDDFRAIVDSLKVAVPYFARRYDPAYKRWLVMLICEVELKKWAISQFDRIIWDGSQLLSDVVGTFTCPCCGSVSNNPSDVKHAFCAMCGWFSQDGPPCPKHTKPIEQPNRRKFSLG